MTSWFSLALLVAAIQSPPVPPSKSQGAPLRTPKARLEVLPASLSLRGPRDFQSLIVTKIHNGAATDVTERATVASRNPGIVRWAGGRAEPAGNGRSALLVTAGGLTATVPVTVTDATARKPIRFSEEVVPIFTRASCNSGACHGSQYGKGGFKLSLLGFEPEVDYESIAKLAGGRRISLSSPERSLVLLKCTLGVGHQGGRKVQPGSRDHDTLVAWIREGAAGPSKSDLRVVSLEVQPRTRMLSKGETQRLAVRATYSDGSARDVTPWVRYGSLNDAIASVSPSGLVTGGEPGETNVMIRFGGQATTFRAGIPFSRLPARSYPANNVVDKHIASAWNRMGLVPSDLCDDATFLRRVMVDVIGTLPTADEVKAFLADTSASKRTALIDRVLDRPEYADYWTLKWGDLLRSNRTLLGPKGMWSLTNWIRSQFRDNRPMDALVRDLIVAQGSTFTNGPANYYRVSGTPPERAETTAQVFLGMRVQCAKCHNHPFERWTQEDYYRFAAYFARIELKGSQEFGIFGNERVVLLNNSGQIYHPKSNALMKPSPLGGYPASMRVKGPQTADLLDPEPDAGGDRRSLLAEWVVKDNPLFARNIVNRYWGYLMGRGLVEPLDDQRVTNPPTHPELLDELSADFMKNGYDVKRLIRIICNSRAYQLSADVTPANRRDSAFYTHYRLKRLQAEPLFDAVNAITGLPEKFPDLPLGYRAIQLPDPLVNSYFLDTFGRAPRATACECDRAAEPNMTQALHLMMGDMVNSKVVSDEGLIAKRIQAKAADVEIVTELYLRALGRAPRSDEREKALSLVTETTEANAVYPATRVAALPQVQAPRTAEPKARDRRKVLEDILWALLNSKEFLFSR